MNNKFKLNKRKRALGKQALRNNPDLITEHKQDELSKLKQVVDESQEVLLRCKTMPLASPFPDSISIDRHKLTITRRRFFKVGQTVSVPIKDIKNIEADLGLMNGTITITSDNFVNSTQTIQGLKRDDAKNIQRLVQGAMTALEEDIDIFQIKGHQLKDLLMTLGQGHTKQIT